MKNLIKLFLILATFFASTFIVIKLTGVITVDDIKAWLEAAKTISPVYIAAIVALLLFADLFIAIPTLTVCLLSGYFLGFGAGALAAMMGVTFAGFAGYTLSRLFGPGILQKVVKDDEKVREMETIFNQHGFIMILLSRAMPILPESAACMSGITRMAIGKFSLAWVLASYPYAAIAAYAGSVSTIEDPKPAIFTAIGITTFFWIGWVIFSKYRGAEKKNISVTG